MLLQEALGHKLGSRKRKSRPAWNNRMIPNPPTGPCGHPWFWSLPSFLFFWEF